MRVERFRALFDLSMTLAAETTVLIGENNSGKTSMLHALAVAFGHRKAQLEDLFDGPHEKAVAFQIDLKVEPWNSEEFPDAVRDLVGAAIQLDADVEYFVIRVEGRASAEGWGITLSRRFLKGWATNSVEAAKVGVLNTPSVSREVLELLHYDMLDARRDIVEQLRNRSTYWGRTTSSISIDANVREELERSLRKLGDEVTENSEVLAGLWVRRILPVVSVLLFVGVMVPVLWRDRIARFFALGLLLSLACVCGTLPQGRLLLLASVGAVGLIARLVVVLTASDRGPRLWRVGAWGLVALMVLAHAVFAPLFFPLEASAKAREAEASRGALRSARAHGGWEGRTLGLVRAPHAFSAAEFLFDSDEPGRPPARVRALHMGPGHVVLTRSGPNLLSVHDPQGMLREPVSWLFHGLQHPFRTGSRVALDAVAFEVLSVTPGGRPTTVLCRFDRPFEDPDLVWLSWRGGRYVPFEPPALGERLVVP